MQITLPLLLSILSIVGSVIGMLSFHRIMKKDKEEKNKEATEARMSIAFLKERQEKHETLLENRMSEVSTKIDALSNLIISVLIKGHNHKDE